MGNNLLRSLFTFSLWILSYSSSIGPSILSSEFYCKDKSCFVPSFPGARCKSESSFCRGGPIAATSSSRSIQRRTCNLLRLVCAREQNAPQYERGYGNSGGGSYPEEHLAGVWKLEFHVGEGIKRTTKKEYGKFSVAEALSRMVALNRDGSCTNPQKDEKWVLRDIQGRERVKGYWRVEGDEVTVTIQSRSSAGKTILRYQGRIRENDNRPYGSFVQGNVLDGEESPEWAGSFSMMQVIGGASMGMGPSNRPSIMSPSRASQGFDLAGRSNAEVLKRFVDPWIGEITFEEARLTAALQLFPNGTFASTSLRRISSAGVAVGGTLRGRWNVYYSEAHGRDRFWLQVLRLRSSGPAAVLSQDWLLLGDLAVDDTFHDLQAMLRRQQAAGEGDAQADGATDAEPSDSASSIAGDGSVNAELTGKEQDEDSVPEAYRMPPQAIEGSAEAAAAASAAAAAADEEEEEQSFVERGIFTRGRPRRYRVAGDVLVGFSHLPEVVGRFRLVQRRSPSAGDAPSGSGSDGASMWAKDGESKDFTDDMGLGGGDEL